MLTLTQLESRDCPNVTGTLADGVLTLHVESSHVVTVGVHTEPGYANGVISVTRDDAGDSIPWLVLPRVGVNVDRIEIDTLKSGKGTQSIIVLDESLGDMPVTFTSGSRSEDGLVDYHDGNTAIVAQKQDTVYLVADSGDVFDGSSSKRKATTIDSGSRHVVVSGSPQTWIVHQTGFTTTHMGPRPVYETLFLVPVSRGVFHYEVA